mgnify:CR=1 FL=1
MKKGDKVKIYQKPLTEEDFEGEAILIKCECKNDLIESWLVKFSDGNKVFRHIKK